MRQSFIAALILVVASFATTKLSAQDVSETDSLRSYDLDAIVVTANRAPSAIRTATTAVSRLERDDLTRLPSSKVSDILEFVPGFAFVSLDGLGFDPQVTARGFYGGGEAEYVTLLIDGRPVNNIERGAINWNLLNALSIESIETVKGSASAMYGDVAVGGIINVRTTPLSSSVTRASVKGSGHQTVEGDVIHSTKIGESPVVLNVGGLSTDGFRDHARRTFLNLGASASVFQKGGTDVSVSTNHHFSNSEVPGPVAAAIDVADSLRTFSSPLYRFDENTGALHRLSISLNQVVSPSTTVSVDVAGLVERSDAVRTLELFPGFGDSQDRAATAQRGSASAFAVKSFDRKIPGTLTIGVEGTFGRLSARYKSYFTGGADDYASATGVGEGDLQSDSIVKRTSISPFAQLDIQMLSGLLLSAGVRYDKVSDTFDPVFSQNDAESSKASHSEVSPRIGLNASVIRSKTHVGNIYASVSRTFKTPTLDQLYDQRLIPFGDFSISLANSLLKPQSGIGYEVGYYHSLQRGDKLQVEGSVALYTIDMTNELDFSLQTFSYNNLGKSLHQGVETSANITYDGVSAFINYTLQDVTLQFGDNNGNAVKAIPKDLVVAGLAGNITSKFGGSMKVRRSARTFLDDENTVRLPNYSTLDAKVFYRLKNVTAALNVANLLNKQYSTTGYVLSVEGLGSQLNMYPAVGRYITLGLELDLR